MNGSTRRHPGLRRLSSGRSQLITSGTMLVRRIARPADRVRLELVAVAVEIGRARKAPLHPVGAVVEEIDIADLVQQVRHVGAADQQRRLGGGVDDAVPGVHRDREQAALLPFEHVLRAVLVQPDLGGAAAFGDQVDLFVEMPFGVQRAGRPAPRPHTGPICLRCRAAGYSCRGRPGAASPTVPDRPRCGCRCRGTPARLRPP